MFRNEEMSFRELYNISTLEYTNIQISDLPFSNRTINRLMGNGIQTLEALLGTTPDCLIGMKGFGKTCYEEVTSFFMQFSESSGLQATHMVHEGNFDRHDSKIGTSLQNLEPSPKLETASCKKPSLDLFRCVEDMVFGDFSCLENPMLSKAERAQLYRIKDAYNTMGEDLFFDCFVNYDSVIPIIEMLLDFRSETELLNEIRSLLDNIPIDRRGKKVSWYIRAFTINDEERKKLQALCKSDDTTIAEFALAININDDTQFALSRAFLKWCSFDLRAEISQLFDKLYINDRAHTTIEMRAAGHTLEQIGKGLGVTRERIRQIEMKVRQKFAMLHSRIRIVSKIAAEHNGDSVITPIEISRFCNDSSNELLYLLKSYESTNYIYDKQLDVFIVGDDSLHSRVDNYLETLPNIIAVSQFEGIAATAAETEGIPREMLDKAFHDCYRQTESVYHRSRLTLATIYQEVLRKHYPQGMHVYSPSEIAKFREYIIADYGDLHLPENDRALAVRITDVGMLCGRGIYRAKKKQYMPKVLLKKIDEHITKSDSSVFLTNSLFNIFEEELLAAGIDNRYYLQGVLHEVFADKFVFKRDYISKDANVTSVYTAIVNFIKKSKYPVSKLQIQNEFPGITDIVISLAVSDPEVLNYFGEYLHASNLYVTDAEQQYLYDIVSRIVSDNMSHHVKDFYEVIGREKPEILTRNAILYPFGAYSLLEYLFREQFQFLRPYIASMGTEIGRAGERLKELIYSTDGISIADIRDFAKENRFQIQSMIDYANACNDEFLLVDKDTLMRIDKIQITETTAKQIEDCVAQAVTQTTPIYQLSVWKALPALSVPWTDWLLYSVLNKWATKVSVGTSSNQMKMAVPLVAPAGELNTTALGDTAMIGRAATIKFDDLDNIDELLEDIIGDDIWEDTYEL